LLLINKLSNSHSS